MALTPHTGTLGKQNAAHLLRRACFGASIDQIDEFAGLTAQQAVQRIFQEDLPTPTPPIDPLTGEEWITTGRTDANSEEFELENYLMDWWMGQFLSSGVSNDQSLAYACRERMIFFLHTLFTTKRSSVSSNRAVYYQIALLRQFAFDKNDVVIPPEPDAPEGTLEEIFPRNLKVLTNKISVENAMLRFLDGRLNVKGSPNENYARELLELYSIGRGLEGNIPQPEFEGDYFYYTEEDVQAAARVLSGFNIDGSFGEIDEDTGLPTGVVRGGNTASAHDNDDKSFSNRFAGQTITARAELLNGGNATRESVLDEISQLVDLIYDQRETSRHIMRKLYRFYVYHQIDAATSDTIIEDLADIFATNEYKLQPVLEELFSSQEFYGSSDAHPNGLYGSIIKSPLDLVVGFDRTLAGEVPEMTTDTDGFYAYTNRLRRMVDLIGLNLYEPDEVAGYSAYHQYPAYNRNWINTTYLTNRYNFIRDRIGDGFSVDEGRVSLLQFVTTNFPSETIRDPQRFTLEVVSYFLPMFADSDFTTTDNGELTNARLQFFYNEMIEKEGLGPAGAEAWQELWSSDDYNEAIAAERLSFLFNAILQSPEYQLM